MATENNPVPNLSGPTEPGFAGTSPTSARPELMRRVVDGAHATIDRLAETAEPVVSRLSDGVDHTAGSLHQRADQLREAGDEWAESLRGSVRQHPMTAVAIALGVGLLVARLSR